MFEQLPAWHSKISLRAAIFNAIGFGFVAGFALGVFVISVLRVSEHPLGMLIDTVVAMALAIRFGFLAISRAQESKST